MSERRTILLLTYLMLALCVPGALAFTALAFWLDSLGLVWLALVVILLATPPYAMGAMKVMQRIEDRRE